MIVIGDVATFSASKYVDMFKTIKISIVLWNLFVTCKNYCICLMVANKTKMNFFQKRLYNHKYV